MPIVVNHSPSASSLARVGYQTGAGQFMQQQREMAQRERMQMRSIEAQQRMAMFQSQQANQRMMFGAGMRREDMLNEQRFRQEMRQEEIKNQQVQMAIQQKQKEDLLDMQFENAEQTDQRRFFQGLVESRKELIDEAMQDGMGYTDEEQATVDSLNAQIDDLNSAVTTITPLQRAMAFNELMNKMPIPSQPKISPEQEFMDSIVRIGEGENEQQFIPNGRGGWEDITPKPDSKQLEMQQEQQQQQTPPSVRFFADPDQVNKMIVEVTKLLTVDGGEFGPSKIPSTDQVFKHISDVYKKLDEEWAERRKKSPQFGQNFQMDAEGNIVQ